jgi:hypothetical protein
VRGDRRANQRKAEAGTAGLATSRRPQPIERFEHAIELVGRHARPSSIATIRLAGGLSSVTRARSPDLASCRRDWRTRTIDNVADRS